ncbi:MAG: WD40 repeat domain-containing protein [Flavobacteriales bacterium]|nr:WD40 repeat domain-containing protein [Flavobacteriales bacterium]
MKPQVRARFTGHKGPVYALVQGPRPGTFLSGSGDGHVVLWDLQRPDHGELLVNVGQPVFSLHINTAAERLYIGADSGSLHVIDLRDRKEIQLLQHQHKGLYAIQQLPHDRLVCAGGDGTLAVYQLGDRLMHLRTIPLIEGKLRGFAVHGSGTLLAVACGDGTVRVLDTEHFNERQTLQAHEGGALSVAFHPTKPVLVSGGKDGHLRLWHAEDDWREVVALPAHKSSIYRIAFNAEGTICATASRDKSAKCWAADTFAPLARLDRPVGGHSHSVNALLWSGEALITGGDDRTVLAWS